MKKKKAEIPDTAQYINVVDILDDAIITRDDMAISVYELSPVNADLLTANEQIEFVSNLTGCLAAIRVPYKILAVPRPFDIQPYLDRLTEQRRTADDEISKQIIYDEISELVNMVSSGNVVEKFFYLVVWESTGEDYLKSRSEVARCWEDGHISAELLTKPKLMQLINLLFNPSVELSDDDCEPDGILPQLIQEGLK